jgi:hypothetical protein
MDKKEVRRLLENIEFLARNGARPPHITHEDVLQAIKWDVDALLRMFPGPEKKRTCQFCKLSRAATMEQMDVYGETRKYLTHLCYKYTDKPLLSTEVCEYFELEEDADSKE